MPSFDYDFRYLQAGQEVLENYLTSPDVYWPVGVHPPPCDPPYPQLTLGGMLLARRRAQATAGTLARQAQLAALEQRMDAQHSQWRVAWGKKATREAHARLAQWRNFLEEYREQPESNHDRYAYEVRLRVMFELLAPDADGLVDADRDFIAGLDVILKALLKPGSFMWDAEVKPAFPQAIYWYLYGYLPKVLAK